MSCQGWQTKNQLEKRVRIDPGKKGVLEESKAVELEAAMMMDLKDVIDMNLKDGELDVEGVVVSLVKAQLCLLADLEAKGFIDPKLLPSTMKWGTSLDGTVLKNGTSVVVVGITPMNLNLSCQSSDCVAPIAFIRSGEDVDIIGEVLKEVMRNIKQQLDADVGLECHGHRECIFGCNLMISLHGGSCSTCHTTATKVVAHFAGPLTKTTTWWVHCTRMVRRCFPGGKLLTCPPTPTHLQIGSASQWTRVATVHSMQS
jgi:hypothetical protein